MRVGLRIRAGAAAVTWASPVSITRRMCAGGRPCAGCPHHLRLAGCGVHPHARHVQAVLLRRPGTAWPSPAPRPCYCTRAGPHPDPHRLQLPHGQVHISQLAARTRGSGAASRPQHSVPLGWDTACPAPRCPEHRALGVMSCPVSARLLAAVGACLALHSMMHMAMPSSHPPTPVCRGATAEAQYRVRCRSMNQAGTLTPWPAPCSEHLSFQCSRHVLYQ